LIVEFQDKKIDLAKVVRLYPAALIAVPDDTPAEVSLEWAESKADKIDVSGYVLVFDYAHDRSERIVLEFASREDMDEVAMQIAPYFSK